MRRFLLLRCYMNPGGAVGDAPERTYFSTFRPYFIAAGFEVVDCPPLTKRGKNAADIRMVIDALDALDSQTHYDEFVIASADADFTPQLQRLRARDRRTTLVTSGDSTTALGAIADVYVDDQQLLGLLDAPVAESGASEDTVNGANLDARFRRAVAGALAASAKALNLSRLSASIQRDLGLDVGENGWPGGPGFAQAIRSLAMPGVELSGHFVYDTARHDPPVAPAAETPGVIDRVSQVLGFPRLTQETWGPVFAVLAEYAADQEFTMTEGTKWARDELAERGHQVGRQALGYVVKGAMSGGADLRNRPDPSEIAEAVLAGGVLARAEDLGLELSEADIAEIRAWLGLPAHEGNDGSASP